MDTTAISPTGPAAFGVIAERFRRAGQADKAVALCREGLERFPDHLSARVTLGWALLDLGDDQAAYDELKRVLKRAPDNLAAIRGLAELHERGVGLSYEPLADIEPEPLSAEPEENTGLEDLDPFVPAPLLAEAAEAADLVADPAPLLIADDFDRALDDLDPIVEPDPLMAPLSQLAIEDVLALETEPRITTSALAREPISLFARAPLALRDEADEQRVDELNDWLDRVRGRRTASVSQYMAG